MPSHFTHDDDGNLSMMHRRNHIESLYDIHISQGLSREVGIVDSI